MFLAIKVAITAVLSLLWVTAFWLVIDSQLLLNLVSVVIGLSAWLFSDWFVDWMKDNV